MHLSSAIRDSPSHCFTLRRSCVLFKAALASVYRQAALFLLLDSIKDKQNQLFSHKSD